MPLRPLRLGDMYDAAFKIVRFNPTATVGAAVLVSTAGMVIPVIATAVLAFATDVSMFNPTGSLDTVAEPTSSELVAGLLPTLLLLVGSLLSGFGLIFVTGMVAHVTAAAAIGRRLGLAEAWAATKGKRWRLVGLSLVLGTFWLLLWGATAAVVVLLGALGADLAVLVVVGGVVIVAGVVASVFFWVRLHYLAVPPLMLEPIGVFAALGRGWRLTVGHFWRTLGIGVLTLLVTGFAAQLLTLPLGLLGAGASLAIPDPETAIFVSIAAQALATVLSTAFTAPFTAGVTSLQYLDLRMRKEAYDVELLTRAGVTGA